MFVVIQKIYLKKPNQGGAYLEYQVTSTCLTIDSKSRTSYSYYPDYEKGRFKRPHMEAYKVSIHESYRENRKVCKKQYVVGTFGYYDLAEGIFTLYDYADSTLTRAAKALGTDIDVLYDMVGNKLEPLQKCIQAEFKKTEEYKAVKLRDKIQKDYQKAKSAFAKEYHVDEHQYDYCHNIFGEVMDQDYLDKIVRDAQAYRSYSESAYSNHSSYSNYNGSYFGTSASTYTATEKTMLKKFYKALSVKFHPDKNPDTDTTEEMQFLNKLKSDWDL